MLNSFPATVLEFSTTLNLSQDDVLYRRGEKATCVYFVETGRVRLFSFDAEGRLVPLYVVRPGECVSEAALFAETYCGDASAEVNSRVRCFFRERVAEALRNDSKLSTLYMTAMARRFNALRVLLELRNIRSARERVLQYLIASAPEGSDHLTVDRPLKSMADDIGLSPECFYRVLADLNSEGVVTRSKRLFTMRQNAPGKSVSLSNVTAPRRNAG